MNKLELALQSENIQEIKNCLKAYITGDPTDADGSIRKALIQIDKKQLQVFEKNEESNFVTDKSRWSQDYFVDLQVDLRMNFSKERFIHMLEVGKVAFKQTQQTPSLIKNEENKKRPVTEKITLKTNPTQMRTSQKHNGYSQEDTGKKTRKILYWGGIVAIAAIVAVIVIRNN